MMPSYKFVYFDLRARGELTRYVFHAASKEFEDSRFSFEEWNSLKPTMPFGQAPVLLVDGKTLAQSGAIARFLAREFGLAGKNSWEQGMVDQYMELATEMMDEIVKWYFEKDEEKKKERLKNLNEAVYPKYLGLFQNALEQNGGNYFVGTELTAADLAVLDIFDTPMYYTPNFMDSFPKLKAHRERIASLENLANYIKKRNVTDL
ncbi:glutathione S-transferase 1-like isoform X1 [Mercenaria mercenaria]|uniref:glutathione S-transferase 1-like isoform X1 n=1 Tax=Mercenaria mercenaria TaxID=6596 RepID=UPI00234E498E|nr:glutathione S-transferase 1-like isoform X1 [Mercenaria mercenaria]